MEEAKKSSKEEIDFILNKGNNKEEMKKEIMEKVSGLQYSSLIKEKNISLILDDYNDIFSDFDPRPYSEKALSVDFLDECRRASKEKPEDGKFELRFLIPSNLRKVREEGLIKKRLKDHFKKHMQEVSGEVGVLKKEAYGWFIAGIVLMVLGTLLYDSDSFIKRFLLVLIEPAGWFLFWEALNKLTVDVKEKNPDLKFYQKMANAEIIFTSY